MRQTIILILTLALTLTATGQKESNCPTFNQENKCRQNEIGINLYNITFLKIKFYPYKPIANQNFANGIMFKRHCDKDAFRIGFDYYYSKFSIEDSGTYHYYINEGQNKIGELRIGYERKLTTAKLQPFFAADLSLTYGQIKGITGGRGDIVWWYTESPYNVIIKEIGITPAIGLKYRPITRLSISIEANIILSYYNHKNVVDSVTDTGLRLFVTPLRLLSANYHF